MTTGVKACLETFEIFCSSKGCWGLNHRHYIHRLHLPAYAAEKVGSAVGKAIYINPKFIFMTLSRGINTFSIV